MQQEQLNKKKDLFTDEGGSYYLFILQNKWHNELLKLLTFLHTKPKIELKFKSTILLILSIQSEAEWAFFFFLNLQYKSFIGRSSCFWRPLLAVCDKKKRFRSTWAVAWKDVTVDYFVIFHQSQYRTVKSGVSGSGFSSSGPGGNIYPLTEQFQAKHTAQRRCSYCSAVCVTLHLNQVQLRWRGEMLM